MNVDKDIQRISWRFGDGQFKPNSNDVDALNNIIQWVNDQRKITLNKNHLFAKLYIYQFNQHLDKYKSTVFDKIPQVELSRLLSTKLDLFYESFTNSLNDNNRYKIFEDNGIRPIHPDLRDDQEDYENDLKAKAMSVSDVTKIKEGVWKLEDVKTELNRIITETLNRFQ